jgi:hypothetical protein
MPSAMTSKCSAAPLFRSGAGSRHFDTNPKGQDFCGGRNKQEGQGIDPIWFGIFVVLMCELGMITPPVGMNLYVVQGVRRDRGDFADVIWRALPYALLMLAFTGLLILAPELALWLPRTMIGP